MSTPTPRTDSEEYPEGEGQNFHVVSADFARTLERELAAERAKVRVLREALDEAQSCGELTGYYFRQARAALAKTEESKT